MINVRRVWRLKKRRVFTGWKIYASHLLLTELARTANPSHQNVLEMRNEIANLNLKEQ